ncbi:MAG: ribosome biogenesis GTPase Der [Bacteroidales bacterium]|jgi:GTP-binding protein|nr:ribosome biogenesis GTPase Der [Bacteroidales bacterium]MDD4256730.1 ribosome biogenesis GTPase Der [Bacteroidales bacterium]MDD4654078.1 ribosome biogenesis GTPase Der [Bacteroidales bacterium]MDD4827338.1 ribosome biogenesis GTPase Der [Bacteroidales bacterium]HPS24348.1 ribosome biogenesis GTPase Der [Bacteroidales bacterium]
MSIVAIVGRPNVGKSTLFNRLVGMRQAIVDEVAGVTRDRHYGKSDWNGREFSVIDTGGYAENSDDLFEEEIRKQVLLAIDEADLVIFLVDVQTGITDYDTSIAKLLRRTRKPVIVVVNKVDHGGKIYDTFEFNALGLGEPISIAAANGSGTGDLLDKVLELLPPASEIKEEEKNIPHIAIVGRPNVGKSSLTNALLGQERNIVTPIAGTTRDSIATYYNKFGHEFMLIDTAGLRKKNKKKEDLEFYSSMRAIRSIEFADVCVLMTDAEKGIESQDMSVLQLILRNKKGCVVVVNKWDLIEKESNTLKEYEREIRTKLAPFSDVPIIFTSVTNKQRILNVLEAAEEVYQNRNRRIPTSRLNEVMLPEIENFPPPALKGKFIKIKFITQLPTPCPSFAFFCNLPQYVREDYKRFLENKLRTHFSFKGTPVQIFIRQK